MARIPYIEKSDLSPANQDLLEKNYTAFRALANSPDCLRVFWGLGGYFQGGGLLAPRLRELALLQIGCLSGCTYEWSHHVKIALAVGITEEEIRVVTSGMGQKSVALASVERAALRATCEMYQGTEASAEIVAELQRLLGPAALVELVVLIGLYTGMVRILSTLGIDVEPEYETYLQRFPLPWRAVSKA